jgi:uncharacterized protein (DUF1697 family)
MNIYISLLRGINVGGQKIIKMNDLKKLYENSGMLHVKTYLQSGNVVFVSNELDTQKITKKITEQIQLKFGFEVHVLLLTEETLKEIIKQNPFKNIADLKPQHLQITFLSDKINNVNLSEIESKKQPEEQCVIINHAVYLYCPNGYGKTKLHNQFFETKLKVKGTTRNWKTTNELIHLVQEMNAQQLH